MDQTLEEQLWGLITRLGRPRPFDEGPEALAAGLAFLGGAQALGVFLVNPDGRNARLVAEHGLPEDYLRRFPVGAERPLSHLTGDLRDAAALRQPVSVAELGLDPRTLSLAGAARAAGWVSGFAAPAVFDGRLVGLVHALFDGQRRAARARNLERSLSLLAPALDRQRQAPGPVDTGEARYGGAQILRALRQAHAGAQRAHRRYAVAVYQLDRPEVLAQRYGASLAEQALDRLAALAVAECRVADAAGRLAPFGVVMVMPDGRPDGAFVQARRVLERLGNESFPFGDARLQVSARVGISGYPENGAHAGEASLEAARQSCERAEGTWVIALSGAGAARPREA